MGDAPLDIEPLLERAFRYALALTHEREGARDLVQDACVRVARTGGPWSVGYVLSAVRSSWIDWGRHERRRAPENAHAAAIDPPAAHPPPPRNEALEAALARLAPDERELIYLAAVEGYTASELAQLTGSPRGTILSRLHRAKQKLRSLLAGRCSEVDA
jgi:RNA polymerase sigma-70 factor (ECF subfamily)